MRRLVPFLFLLLLPTSLALRVNYELGEEVHLKIIDILHKKTSSYYASYTDTCYQTVSYCSKYETITYECGTETYTERNCGWSWECKYEPKCGYFIDGVKCDKWFLFICLHWSLKYSYKCIYVKSCGWVLKCEDVQKERPKYCSEEKCVSKEERKEPYSCIKKKLVTRETDHYKVEVNGRTYEGNQEPLELNVPRGYVHVKDLVDGEEWGAYFMPLISRRSEGEERVFDYRSGESHEGGGFPLFLPLQDKEQLAAFDVTIASLVAFGLYMSRRYYPELRSAGLLTISIPIGIAKRLKGRVNLFHILTGEDMNVGETGIDIGISLIPVIGAFTDLRDTIRYALGKEDHLVGITSMIGLLTELTAAGDYVPDSLKAFLKINRKSRWYRMISKLPRDIQLGVLKKAIKKIGEEGWEGYFKRFSRLVKKVKGKEGYELFLKRSLRISAEVEIIGNVRSLKNYARALDFLEDAEGMGRKLLRVYDGEKVRLITFADLGTSRYGDYYEGVIRLNKKYLNRLSEEELFALVYHEYLHSITIKYDNRLLSKLGELTRISGNVRNQAHDLLTLKLFKEANPELYAKYERGYVKLVESRDVIMDLKRIAKGQKETNEHIITQLFKEDNLPVISEWLLLKGEKAEGIFGKVMEKAAQKLSEENLEVLATKKDLIDKLKKVYKDIKDGGL